MKRLSFKTRKESFQQTSRGLSTLQELEGNSRWVISYADFMTLLLAFFLVSYFAVAQNKQVQPDSTALRTPIHDKQDVSVRQPQELHNLEGKIQEWVHAMKLDPMVDIQVSPRGAVASFKEKLLFKSGKATLLDSAKETLGQFSGFLDTAPYYIRIEGHTDDLPISNSEFPSNWHLGAARASAVLSFLVSCRNVSPDKISATSYGETRPRFPNDTPQHRAQNRRVDIVILSVPFPSGPDENFKTAKNMRAKVALGQDH